MRSQFLISLILLLSNFSLATATRSPQRHHQQEQSGASDPAEAVQQKENKGKRVAAAEPAEAEHGSEAKRQRQMHVAQPTDGIRIGHGHGQQNTMAPAVAHPGKTVPNVPLKVGEPGGLFDAILEEHAREQRQQQQEVQLDELDAKQKETLLELENLEPAERIKRFKQLRIEEERKLKKLKQEKQEQEEKLEHNHQEWFDMDDNKHLVKTLKQVVSNPGPQQYQAIEDTPNSIEFGQRIDNKRTIHTPQDQAENYYDRLVRQIKEHQEQHQAMLAGLLSSGPTLENDQRGHPPMAHHGHVQAVQKTAGTSMAHLRHDQAVPETFPATGQHFMPLQPNQHGGEQPMHHGFPHMESTDWLFDGLAAELVQPGEHDQTKGDNDQFGNAPKKM